MGNNCCVASPPDGKPEETHIETQNLKKPKEDSLSSERKDTFPDDEEKVAPQIKKTKSHEYKKRTKNDNNSFKVLPSESVITYSPKDVGNNTELIEIENENKKLKLDIFIYSLIFTPKYINLSKLSLYRNTIPIQQFFMFLVSSCGEEQLWRRTDRPKVDSD